MAWAASHPLLDRKHQPDAKMPEDKQDKRSVIPIAIGRCESVAGLHRHSSNGIAAACARRYA
jgi:hypothetical protein